MGDRVVPRAEDGLAPHRYLALAGLALLLAGCGSGGKYTNATFRNDVGRPVRLGWCADDPTCRQVKWWITIDPGASATEQLRSDGKAWRRFVFVTPPERVYGCFQFHFDRPRPEVTLRISQASGCGSGR